MNGLPGEVAASTPGAPAVTPHVHPDYVRKLLLIVDSYAYAHGLERLLGEWDAALLERIAEEGERLVAVRKARRALAPAIVARLTRRQCQTAVLLVKGNVTDAQIGAVMGCSRETVSNHIQAVYTATGMSNRVELAMYLVRNSDLVRELAGKMEKGSSK